MTSPTKYYLYAIITDKETNGNTGTLLITDFATEKEAQEYAVYLKEQKYYYDYKIIDTLITDHKLTPEGEKFYFYIETSNTIIFCGEFTDAEQAEVAMDQVEEEFANAPNFIRTFILKEPLEEDNG